MPELDEQKLEEMDLILKKAIKNESQVKIIYYEDKRDRELIGVPAKYLPAQMRL